MSILEVLVLGLIQGLTEFLPVSSSGHLVLGSSLLGISENSLTFDIALHLGSLVAVFIVYRSLLLKLLRAAFRGRIKLVRGQVRYSGAQTRLLYLLILATIPAAAVGFFLREPIEAAFDSPVLAAAMLLVTGTVLFISRWARPRGRDLNWKRTGLIGCAQALAVIPGLSRSGLTISTGLLAGLKRREAADFSFLLSVPVILGAGAAKLFQGDFGAGGEPTSLLLIGAAAAALSGYVAVRILLRVVTGGELHRFCWYCWGLGIGSLILLLT